MGKPRAYMSFGGGVQSTAIAMLAINRDERLLKATDGVLPELYIFADTGDEPEAVYRHVAEMKDRIERSGAVFMEVRRKDAPLSKHVLDAARTGSRLETPPFFVWDGEKHSPITHRGCTRAFKTRMIEAGAREFFGVPRGGYADNDRLINWQGISQDEVRRAKYPFGNWYQTVYPLLTQQWSGPPWTRGMNCHRADCKNYLAGQGIDAPRSACWHCPFRSIAEWREMKKSAPSDYAKAVAYDNELERLQAEQPLHGLDGHAYINREGVRMRDLDLSERANDQTSLWDNECAGVCGV